MQEPDPVAPQALDTIARTAAFLYGHGQSTAMTLTAVERLSCGLGQPAVVIPGWTSITTYDPRPGGRLIITAARPNVVNMRRVATVMRAVDAAEDGPVEQADVERALTEARDLPVSATPIFVAACALGAGALALVFGATDVRVVGLVAAAAGIGGLLRRLLGRLSVGPLVEMFGAALVAGGAGAIAMHANFGVTAALVAVCPAMVLVPGPQILIGAMDLLALRIPLAMARLCYAGLVLATIAAGLIVGLRLGGQSLPVMSPGAEIPFIVDVLAAGVAAACYPVFFSMPYRLLGWPIVAGMVGHALHWWSMTAWHASLPVAALVSCLVVGTLLTPVAYRLRIPFAAIGFAAVVALVPGVYVFRTVAGLTEMVSTPTTELILDIGVNGVTAALTVVCMALGLTLPTFVRDRVLSRTRQAAS
ncbi:threonine/serine exporter family protein [Mycolicibacterium sp. Dal123E01]|uniref:threonine/serine exporter family protein n=1 Tax=Mycolicibacterium sp. Dal123E01 TaxID=3457578 RepID=UPI00403EE3CD